MPQEVRYILFHQNETEEAVLRHVIPPESYVTLRRGPDLRIDLTEDEDGGLRATVFGLIDPRGGVTPRKLNESELHGALLAWCRRRGVPLPRRATKSLELLGTRLAMTITLNAATQEIRTEKGSLRYVDPMLDALRPTS